MGNLHLVTGYAGAPHVSSSDQGSLYEALIRGGQFVLDAGAKFSASIVSNNQVRVNDGELMMQGRHVKLTPGAYVDLTVDNGTQGYSRTDLIVARYTKAADTGIEECSLVVIKGTPAGSKPSDPEYTTGIINAEGALQHDFPLYRVSISGLVLEGLTGLFEPQNSLFDYAQAELKKINSTLHVSVQTVSELRAINTADTTLFKNGTLIMVQENGLFVFNRGAIGGNGADGNAIIAPITGGGGWVPATTTDIAMSSRYVATADELDLLLTTTLLQMSDKSVKFMVVDGLNDSAPLWGGTGHIVLYKDTNACATATMITYRSNNTAKQCTKAKFDGIWGGWVTLPYLDANGKIPLDQLPSSVLPASIE